MRASTALGRNIQFLETDKSMFHAHKCMDGKKEEQRFPAGAEQRKIVVSKGKVDSQCTSGLTIVPQVNKKNSAALENSQFRSINKNNYYQSLVETKAVFLLPNTVCVGPFSSS